MIYKTLALFLLAASCFSQTIRYNQIYSGDRQGDGNKVQMTTSAPQSGCGQYDGAGNLVGTGTACGGGGGGVTSVGMTVPTGLAVSGSPITTSGVLGITLSGTFPSTSIPAINIAASGAGGVIGNLPVSSLNGGTGASSSTFWRGDGTWVTPAGAGTVTSVGMTVPTGLSVSGSPITGSGTLAVTLSGTFPTTSIPAINLSASGAGGVTGNLPVTNLNSGTSASSSTFWRGDGTWATPAGSGTVTSVALTVPTGFSVSGSPVTSSGTLAVTYTSGQAANSFLATPNGSTGALSIRTIVGADLPNPSSSTLGGIQSLAAVTSKWINTISTSGVPTATQPAESDLSFTDITTNDVSTSKHGYAPRLPNDATKYLDGTGAYTVPSGSGGMVKLSQVVVGTATASITFSSISGSYSNLMIVLMGRESDAVPQGDIYMEFNSDTGNEYSRQYVGAFNTTAVSGTNLNGSPSTSGIICSLPGTTAPANAPGVCTITIIGYSQTTFYKGATSAGGWKNSTPQSFAINIWWEWDSTSAVTDILLHPVNSANFVTGTTATLYGMP